MSLLAMAIHAAGDRAHSFTGQQAGFFTDTRYGAAHQGREARPRAERAVARRRGHRRRFPEGINAKGDATTLERGGSGTSAVALAVALGADICEIYTDVDGVFTADPRIVPKASRIPVIGYDEILEMSSCGSKVLALRCVEYAQRRSTCRFTCAAPSRIVPAR